MAASDYQYNHFNVTFPSEYVAQVEINRPAKLNAFFEQMWVDLGAIFRKLSVDPDVRAIILTAAGDRAFTAGLDVQAASTEGVLAQQKGPSDGARTAVRIRRHMQGFQDDITALEKCEKPVIAVLHGISYGLAIDMTTACDIRICSKDTRFSVREVEIGLAADIGTLTRLPKANVPMSWVKEVCLTARDFYADEALRVGFVSAVYESKAAALEKAIEMGKLLATKSPVAVQSTKEVINFSRDHSVADGKCGGMAECRTIMLTLGHRSQLCEGVERLGTANQGCPRCDAGRTEETKAHLCEAVTVNANHRLSLLPRIPSPHFTAVHSSLPARATHNPPSSRIFFVC